VEAPIARTARVRSSSGRAEKRFFVETTMHLGGVEKQIEISLASREPMIFRMLLGRTALTHDFVIDPAHRYLTSPTAPSAEGAHTKKQKKKKASLKR
jgi:hypothetical protein